MTWNYYSFQVKHWRCIERKARKLEVSEKKIGERQAPCGSTAMFTVVLCQ